MKAEFEVITGEQLATIDGGKFGLTKSGRDHWCTFSQFAEVHPVACSGFPGGNPGPKQEL